MKLGFGPSVCTTVGESDTAPDPKLLPEQTCDPGVRELIGRLLFLSRCTRFDLSFVIARLARFVARWCEWVLKETRHILGFVAHSAARSLIMKSADDDWEELMLSTFCDASYDMFRRTHSQIDGVRRQFLLDRVGESARAPVHEFDRVRIDQVGTSSQTEL